jgi:hypothetical protein
MNNLGSIGMFAICMEATTDKEEGAVIWAINSEDCTVCHEEEETVHFFPQIELTKVF